jgi:class III poly(R)-hydroxyalkanoic acid synthase PhaE subunit
MDYQEQFFKMWNENMDQMLNSDAYKAMANNIPGAEAYTKAMESMVPAVENYWKTMAASMPEMPANPFMDYWKNMMPASNPYVDFWKGMMPAQSANPFMDYWKFTMPATNPYMDMWNNMAAANPYAEMWKNMTSTNPFVDMWKNLPTSEQMMDYWKDMADKMPDFSEYWKAYTDMIPTSVKSYWDNFAKMMPNPEKFADLAQFKVPGFEAFTKIFDMWKSFGDPDSMVQDFQNKYMDATADIIKSLFPENVQPFLNRPMDYMNIMVDYYKQFVSPWMEIDPEIMKRIGEGDIDAYIDFFNDYQAKYSEYLEKYFTVLGMGLNREANEDYMSAINQWNKAMISMGELLAVITKTAQESFTKIGDKVQADLEEGKTITTFRDFYNVWYSVTEEAFETLLATDEFAKVFDDFSDRYSQFMIAQNKVYERMLSTLPIPTNTDMKSLYKTVYDLRKDVRDLKKAVAAKPAAAEKKGDK